MCHQIVQGVPTLQGLQVVSEPAISLTQGMGRVYSELFSCEGASFSEASRSVMRGALIIWPWTPPSLLEAGYEDPDAGSEPQTVS